MQHFGSALHREMGYRIRLLVIVALLAMIAFTARPFPPAVAFAQPGWFFSITPPSGPEFLVGPYSDHWDCNDMLGSALYSHPFACHTDPSNFNCRITGNGFAYPKDFPYPVPANEIIPSLGCFKSKTTRTYVKPGWYFLFYTPAGGSLERCGEYRAFKLLAKTVPGDDIGFYKNRGCFGAPCFSVGFDTACN